MQNGNLIDKIVASTKNLESPERYFWWSAVSTVAATIRKQVFLDRGGAYKLFPNIYVVLVSKHSGLRKGVPISLAARLLNGVQNTRVIEGQNSIQGLISEFSRQVTLPTGQIFSDAQGILISGEIDNLFVKDPQALTVLTELYNTHEHNGKWRKTLKGSGVEELRNPCICLLGASNETLFEDFIQKKDVEGGFIARTFIVHESKKKLSNPLTEKDPNIVPDKVFIDELKEIGKIKGEFQFSPSAKRLYKIWYRDLDEDIENDRLEDKTGYSNRLGDSVLKVAMLLNLASEKDLIIHTSNLEESIERCESCLSGARIIARQAATTNEQAPITRQITEILSLAPNLSMARNRLLLKLYPAVNSQTFSSTIETMEQAGCIKTFRGEDGKPWHQLLPPALELFSNAKKHFL